MGTSARYGGPSASSALIPTFLEVSLPPAPPEEEEDKKEAPPKSGKEEKEKDTGTPTPLPPLPKPAPPGGFRSSRIKFNSFATTRDKGSLRSSLSKYVGKGTGGGRTATRRMGSSVRSVGNAIGFAQGVARDGIEKTLSKFGLGNLVGQPCEQALAVLTDIICPEGGPIDQAIAREAWDEAVLGLIELDIGDIKDVTFEQWQSLIVDFIARTIEARVINDVGAKGMSLPQDVQAIDQLQTDLHEIILGAVTDAVGDKLDAGQTIDQGEIQGMVTDIYDRSFTYLEGLEDEE